MRIISGAHRGRRLVAPSGQGTRPTADRVRQALFNILEHAAFAPELKGARVMDLFAGAGGLGLEALSRGAAFCLFVETDADARGAIRDNVEALGYFGATRIHRRDATDLGVKPGADGNPFDIAFLDPPYRNGLGEAALKGLAEGGWLANNALAVLEKGEDEPEPKVEGFAVLDARTWGAARVHFLRYAPSPALG